MSEILRHKKTGGLYEVLFRDAQIQTNHPLADHAEVVGYRSLKDGSVWIRPTSEMDDGRFELAGAVGAPGRDDQTARFIADSDAIEHDEAMRQENRRLRIALYDAIRRPLGVTPDSALEFYDQRMADEAKTRRAGGARL